MTDNTTPKRRRNYSRPTHFPVSLAVMMPESMKREIEDAAAATDRSKADIVRERLELGAILLEAYDESMRARVQALARKGSHGLPVTEGEAIRKLITFAVNQVAVREHKDRVLAERMAKSLADGGLEVDGVSID